MRPREAPALNAVEVVDPAKGHLLLALVGDGADPSSRLTPREPTPTIARMKWERPEFVEIKMDCEINSYQDDFQRDEFDGVES
jgi:hypothetical protein